MTHQTYGYRKVDDDTQIVRAPYGQRLQPKNTLTGDAQSAFLNEIQMTRNALHRNELPGAISAICFLWSCAPNPNNRISRASVTVDAEQPVK